MHTNRIVVGARVQDNEGFKATVRYIGPVASATASASSSGSNWIGVEWDDSTRGKHDGSAVDSSGTFRRYFDCAMGKGSFVKESKVLCVEYCHTQLTFVL